MEIASFLHLVHGTKLFLVLYILLFISIVLTCYIFVCMCVCVCMYVCMSHCDPPVQLGDMYSIFVC